MRLDYQIILKPPPLTLLAGPAPASTLRQHVPGFNMFGGSSCLATLRRWSCFFLADHCHRRTVDVVFLLSAEHGRHRSRERGSEPAPQHLLREDERQGTGSFMSRSSLGKAFSISVVACVVRHFSS